MTVVLLLHKHLSSYLALSVILSAFSRTALTIILLSLALRHMSTFRSPFSSRLITSNFFLILIYLAVFFTFIALDDGYLCFSLILVRKASAVDRKFWGHFLLLEQ